MATGDQSDLSARIKALIPNGWFAVGQVPLRDAVVSGAASVLAFAYSLFAYVRLQTRIATATDGWLDMIAGDFFGPALMRVEGQTDENYRAKIQANLFRERGTRASVITILTQLTGRAPIVFEPGRPMDTGAYGVSTSGYGVAGGYGSLSLPMQSFVTAFRQPLVGPPYVAGYGSSPGGYSDPSRADYYSADAARGPITDADIYAAINSVRPASYVIWARISS